MPSQVKFPLAASQDSANDTAWLGVNDIKTNNSTGAVVSESTIGHGIQGSGTDTVFSHVITVSDFDFSIPTGATIQGLTVTLRAAAVVIQETTTAPTAKYYLSLAQNGTPIGSSTNDSLSTSGTYSTYTWGGATNKLGTSVTPSDVNASTFQVKFYAELNCPYSAEFEDGNWFNFFGSSVDVDADYISVEVHYLEPKELDAETDAFDLVGVDATLQYHRRMSVAVGAFTVTGSDINIRRTYRTILFAGTFALTGQTISARRAFSLNPVARSYVATFNDTIFLRTRIFAVNSDSLALTGQANDVYYNRRFVLDLANLQLTGNAASLISAVTLSTDWFQYTSVGYVFEVTSQTFSYTPNAVNLNRGFGVRADTRNINVSGIDALLRKDTRFVTTVQTYSVTGQDVLFSRGKAFITDSGVFTVNSPGAILRRTSDNGNLLVFFL